MTSGTPLEVEVGAILIQQGWCNHKCLSGVFCCHIAGMEAIVIMLGFAHLAVALDGAHIPHVAGVTRTIMAVEHSASLQQPHARCMLA